MDLFKFHHRFYYYQNHLFNIGFLLAIIIYVALHRLWRYSIFGPFIFFFHFGSLFCIIAFSKYKWTFCFALHCHVCFEYHSHIIWQMVAYIHENLAQWIENSISTEPTQHICYRCFCSRFPFWWTQSIGKWTDYLFLLMRIRCDMRLSHHYRHQT